MKQAHRLTEGHERGSAMILSIVMMMSLGLLVLTTLGQHLSGALLLTANEHRYLMAWEQAESSLNWGMRLSWAIPSGDGWQCQRGSMVLAGLGQPLTSCIRPSLREGFFLLKGEGITTANAPPLTLYQQVKATKTSEGRYVLSALKQGWLDFCPESDATYCDATHVEATHAKGI
ncbi:YgdB family protein [Ewingella americana]|uniref:DUF2509 family protein n=1 Tax=Ewingella americana TaxID=41202 RepID=A0A502GGM9_9GAMM|nr:DUF2509 family protein [Ewingella americana]